MLYCSKVTLELPLAIFALFFSSCDEENNKPCNRPGDEWCDENVIVACLGPENDFIVADPVLERGIDCSKYHGTCVDWRGETGHTVAGCAAPDSECDEKGVSQCEEDNTFVYCEPGMQFVMYGCLGEYCQLDNDGQAACAYQTGTCSDDEVLCDPDDPNAVDTCENGVWATQTFCHDDYICSQISDTEIDCIPPNGIDGK
jgi:hypothetical protein